MLARLVVCLLLLLAQRATAAKNLTAAVAPLEGKSFRCAHTQELQGDGFLFFRDPALVAQMAALPDWGEMELPLEGIDGFNIAVLEAMQAQASAQGAPFTVSYHYLKVPDNPGGSSTEGMARALDEYGYDCLISSVLIRPDRQLAMDFMVPHMPYGYQVLTLKPQMKEYSVTEKMATFTKPFSTGLWFMTFGFLLLAGICGYFVESPWPGSEFSRYKELEESLKLRYESRWQEEADEMGLGIYRALAVPTMGSDGGTPVTGAGRMLYSTLALFGIIVIASYTASLTVVLFEQNKPVATITSIDDFEATGQPACIRSTSTAPLEFMRANYPRTALVIVNGTEPEMARAVMAGQCAGAVSTDVHFKYLLATDNSTCPVHLVGGALSFGYYAMPWRRLNGSAFSSSTFAMSVLLMDLIETNRLIEMANEFFPIKPSQKCGSTVSDSSNSIQLQLDDLAGVFVLMAILMAVVLLLAAWRYWDARRQAQQLQVPLRKAFTTRSLPTADEPTGYPSPLEARETLQLGKKAAFGGSMDKHPSALSSLENGSSGATPEADP